MSNLNRLFVWSTLLLLLGVVGAIGVNAALLTTTPRAPVTAGAASLTLTGPTQPIQISDPVTVTLKSAALNDALSAFEVAITYDPNILALNGVSPGSLLASSGRAVICPPSARTADGVRFACASSGAAQGPTAAGDLAILHFAAVGAGSSPLVIASAQLIDGNRPPTLFGVTSQGTVVAVLAPATTATPTATPTPSPTATATPSPTATATATPTASTPSGSDSIFLPFVGKGMSARDDTATESGDSLFLPNVNR
jgi:hypothetical protein